MRIVKKGEKAAKSTTVKGQVVTVKHVTLNKPSKQQYALTWNFDFDGVSVDDLKRLAARGLVIDQRPKFKNEKDGKKLDQWDNRNFSVAKLLVKERQRVSAAEKAEKAVSNLGVDEQIALLQKLLAAQGVETKTE